MMFLRLLPTILSTVLIAAHVLRFYGLQTAIPIVLLLITLFIKNKFILRFWQFLLSVGIIMWIQATTGFVQMRLTMHQPWVRLVLILGAVILFTLYSIFSLENKKLKERYHA